MKTYELSAITIDVEVSLVDDRRFPEPFIRIEQGEHHAGYGGAVMVPLSELATHLFPEDDETAEDAKARVVSALRQLADRVEIGEGVSDY